jgi:hypothetical protein
MGSQYCNLCGQPLLSEYALLEREPGSKGLAICGECAASMLTCTLCGVPLQKYPIRLSDGRPVCTPCHATAVEDPVTARSIYEQVIDIVEGRLLFRVRLRPGFGLCSTTDMQVLQRRLPQGQAGAGGHLLGAYIKLGRRREIVVESGLPRLMMTKVVAHEYGHAWQGENCPFLTDPQLIEGFCEWVAYKVLGAVNAIAVQEYQRRRNGFYGDALRRMLTVEVEGGTEAIVKLLRTPRILAAA